MPQAPSARGKPRHDDLGNLGCVDHARVQSAKRHSFRHQYCHSRTRLRGDQSSRRARVNRSHPAAVVISHMQADPPNGGGGHHARTGNPLLSVSKRAGEPLSHMISKPTVVGDIDEPQRLPSLVSFCRGESITDLSLQHSRGRHPRLPARSFARSTPSTGNPRVA